MVPQSEVPSSENGIKGLDESSVRILEERAADILDVCKEAFNSEVTRHGSLSGKASLYLTVVGLVFAALSVKIADFVGILRQLPLRLFVIEMVMYAASLIFFAVAIGQIINSIKLFDYRTYPVDIFKTLEARPRLAILSGIGKGLSKAAKENYLANNIKAAHLRQALVYIQAGSILLFLIFISLFATIVVGVQ